MCLTTVNWLFWFFKKKIGNNKKKINLNLKTVSYSKLEFKWYCDTLFSKIAFKKKVTTGNKYGKTTCCI